MVTVWGVLGRRRWPCRSAGIRHRAAPLVPDASPAENESPDAAPPVSHRHKPPLPVHSAVFRTPPRCPPCAGCTLHPVPPRTTFFSRHGFRPCLSTRTRIASPPTPPTLSPFTTSPATSRT